MPIFYGHQYGGGIECRPIASKAQYRVSFLKILIEYLNDDADNGILKLSIIGA